MLRQQLELALQADNAEVLLWRGHLVVIAPRTGKALHFSIPGMEAEVRSAELPDRADRRIPPPDAVELDGRLGGQFELTRVATATAIISRSGPRALLPDEPLALLRANDDVQDLGGGTGVGTCGASCSTSCRDGSSCSTSCGANLCAHCSCPASCTCS
ncbi:MAG: hypothetical protein M3O15_14490 [Acidobacteriota bacterium]|nr:hypothetical protein [Acidobacteriota bacterium]